MDPLCALLAARMLNSRECQRLRIRRHLGNHRSHYAYVWTSGAKSTTPAATQCESTLRNKCRRDNNERIT